MRALANMVLATLVFISADRALGFPKGSGEAKIPGSASRSWLGVSVRDVTSHEAKALGLKSREGAYVSDVMEKSPAESAGVREGDVIVEFNGISIQDADGLVDAVRKADAGTNVKIAVIRKGDRKELLATLQKPPKRRESFAFTPPDIEGRVRILHGPTIGLNVIQLSPQLGKYFEVPDNKGLLVQEVEEGSPAEKAGFKAGDVITKIGDAPVARLRDFRSELAEHKEGDKVNVEVLRKGSRKTLTVEIEKREEGYEFSFDESEAPDIDIDIPEIEHLRHFEFNFDELRPELERLQRELNRLKERIGERIKEKVIRDVRVSPEI